MLSRIVRIPLRYSLSGAVRVQFSTLPQPIQQIKSQIEQLIPLQNEITYDQVTEHLINFTEEIDGKQTILQAFPDFRHGFSPSDVSLAIFSVGCAYGLLTNFNYLLTLGCFAATLATTMTLGQRTSVRQKKPIFMIQVDKADRLHVRYLNEQTQDEDTLIVDKSNFTYNVLKPGIWGTQAIWCKINGEDFWIPQGTVRINNHNLHHLL